MSRQLTQQFYKKEITLHDGKKVIVFVTIPPAPFENQLAQLGNSLDLPAAWFALCAGLTMPNYFNPTEGLDYDNLASPMILAMLFTPQIEKRHANDIMECNTEHMPNITCFFLRQSLLDSTDQLINLLHASHNADLDMVKHIISRNSNPQELLRQRGYCEGRDGTFTALQMAILNDDEEMEAYFKTKMDPNDFEEQRKEVFKNALLTERIFKYFLALFFKTGKSAEVKALDSQNATAETYRLAMIKAQMEDAEKLCAGLEETFKNAQLNEFTATGHRTYIASTTSSTIPKIITDFKARLSNYVSKNPVFNAFILQQLYEIYDRLPYDLNRDCYFSQKALGVAQAILLLHSVRWQQHYADSIYEVAHGIKWRGRRSTICVSGDHSDIRELLKAGVVGDSCCLSIFGVGAGAVGAELGWRSEAQGSFQSFRRAKTASDQKTGYAATATAAQEEQPVCNGIASRWKNPIAIFCATESQHESMYTVRKVSCVF